MARKWTVAQRRALSEKLTAAHAKKRADAELLEKIQADGLAQLRAEAARKRLIEQSNGHNGNGHAQVPVAEPTPRTSDPRSEFALAAVKLMGEMWSVIR